MTEDVATFIAVFAAIVRKARIGRIVARVVHWLRYLFTCHPIGERNRAHTPAQGIEHEEDKHGYDDLLNGNAHGRYYTLFGSEPSRGRVFLPFDT